MSYLLFLRLVPAFPFWVVNIAAAILGVPLKTYVVATFFGIIPATFAFASAGAGLDSVMRQRHGRACAMRGAQGRGGVQARIHASSLVTKELVLASCCSASSRSYRSHSGNGETCMQQPNDGAVGLMRIGGDRAGATMPWPSGPSTVDGLRPAGSCASTCA